LEYLCPIVFAVESLDQIRFSRQNPGFSTYVIDWRVPTGHIIIPSDGSSVAVFPHNDRKRGILSDGGGDGDGGLGIGGRGDRPVAPTVVSSFNPLVRRVVIGGVQVVVRTTRDEKRRISMIVVGEILRALRALRMT